MSLSADAEGSTHLERDIEVALPQVESLVNDRSGELDASDLVDHLRKQGLDEFALRRALWELVRSGRVHLTSERRLGKAAPAG